MRLLRRRFLQLAVGAFALPIASTAAIAEAYPSRPITMVVGFPAGGSADIIARIMAEHMRASLGQPIIVENIAGASGSIAAGRVARSAADGYTLSIGSLGTHVLNGALYTLSYDLLKDLEPVSLLVVQPQLILVRKNMPAKDLRELIAWLRANPDKGSQGTAGPGSIPHVAGVLFQNMTGTRFQLVPYRGSAPGIQDLIAGQIDMYINPTSDSLPHIRSGSVKAYAVADKNRLEAAPEIPTVDEAGLPGFYMTNWYGLWAPKGTSKNVITTLNSAVVASLADAVVRSRLADTGQELFSRDQQTPEALGTLQKSEIGKWWPILKAANIKPE
jgi:tripartite-type tricarboxylate transporter receptor subunit TctC